jgi:hypothetical protein
MNKTLSGIIILQVSVLLWWFCTISARMIGMDFTQPIIPSIEQIREEME